MIFISYRHTDMDPAGRLCSDLKRRFGRDAVFMDVEGSLRCGDLWADRLDDAVGRCQLLVAVIGPTWLQCRGDDGRRRLDCDDDWVRREIATALARKVPVLPVRIGGAALPRGDELPAPLQGLLARQATALAAEHWERDARGLLDDIAAQLPPDDVVSAGAGLEALRQMMMTTPAIANAVGGSRELIANTYRQIERLADHKLVHDALHSVEFDCLRPLQEGGKGVRSPFQRCLAAADRQIRECLDHQAIDPDLAGDVRYQLDLAVAAMAAAVSAPGAQTLQRLLAELTVLLNGLPSRLDTAITQAARALALERLVALMVGVRDSLPEVRRDTDTELAPLVASIDAISRLADELRQLVAEHGQLQALDSVLRAVCLGDSAPASVARSWARVHALRASARPPFSPALAGELPGLGEQEAEIDAALAAGDGARSLGLLRDYFSCVAGVFLGADTRLKEFCLRLSLVAQPLRTVLDQL